MKIRLHLFYTLWLLWLCFGVIRQSTVVCEYTVNNLLDRSISGKVITVCGQMHLGLESGTLYELGSARAQIIEKSGIHIEFDDWIEKEVNKLPIEGRGIVKGLLEGDPTAQYGHMGIYNMRLSSPTVLRWPSPIFEIVFFVTYILLPFLVLFFIRTIVLPGLGKRGACVSVKNLDT